MRIEAKAGLSEARIRNLDEVLFILSPMQELPGEPLGEPQVGGDYLVKDLLPTDGACRPSTLPAGGEKYMSTMTRR